MDTRRTEAEAGRPAPRLYIFADDRETGRLAGVLDSAPEGSAVAAVLLRLRPGGEDERAACIAEAASIVQPRGVALLLEGHADLVARTGADGCHVPGSAALAPTLKRLKPDFIVGAGDLPTRHDAMLAAEAGADYVMFGEPDRSGQRPAFPAIIDRVAWWSEVFEPPCVGYAADRQEAEALARAGADFVAVESSVWDDPQASGAALTDLWTRLQRVEFAS